LVWDFCQTGNKIITPNTELEQSIFSPCNTLTFYLKNNYFKSILPDIYKVYKDIIKNQKSLPEGFYRTIIAQAAKCLNA